MTKPVGVIPTGFQRVEKVFSTRCRLLRKVLNFVFLRTLLYDGTACEQKTKNAQKCCNSMLTALLLFCCKIFMSLSFLYKGVQICRLVFVGVFQGLYRQSGCTQIFGTAFYFCLFTGLFIKGEY